MTACCLSWVMCVGKNRHFGTERTEGRCSYRELISRFLKELMLIGVKMAFGMSMSMAMFFITMYYVERLRNNF